MLRPICKITFTKDDGSFYEFDFVNSVEIKTSYEIFTDTAKITLPRKLSFQGKSLFTGSGAIFKRGDQIKIELGYYPNLTTCFDGYVTFVGSSLPVEIECEDKMFLLKQTTIKKYSVESISLSDLLKAILPSGIDYNCLDVQLGSFRISNATVSKILETLKSDYGFYAYFVDGILHVGLPSDSSDTVTEEFAFEKVIINPDDLKYQLKDEMFIKIVAISMQSDNSKKQVEVGDTDGSQRTFYTYNSSDPALLDFANLRLSKIKYSGYNGSFLTFGEPFVRHGDIAKLTSTKLPERDGNYIISSVTRTFGMDGYRQEINLDGLVSGN
jgi:hypothetical protein